MLFGPGAVTVCGRGLLTLRIVSRPCSGGSDRELVTGGAASKLGRLCPDWRSISALARSDLPKHIVGWRAASAVHNARDWETHNRALFSSPGCHPEGPTYQHPQPRFLTGCRSVVHNFGLFAVMRMRVASAL